MTPDDLQHQVPDRPRIFSYQGRIGRLKYFIAALVVGVISAGVEILIIFLSFAFFLSFWSTQPFGLYVAILGILLLAAAIPSVLASTFIVRRFHDIGKSGKWWFALLIPAYNIHLAIGLLTERGTVGANQYGEDTLPPGVPADDIFHRFSQNKPLRIIAVVVILLLGFVVRFNDALQQRSGQQGLDQAITESVNATENKQNQLTQQQLSQLNLEGGTSTEAQNVDTTGWKSETVAILSASACYTVSYPPQLGAPMGTTDVQGGMHTGFTITAPSASPFSKEDNETVVWIATVNGGAGLYNNLDSAVNDQLAYSATRNIVPQVKDFTMPDGLSAKEMFYPDGSWGIYLEIPGKTQNVVIELTPGYDPNFSLSVVEAMARSIQACQ